MAGSWVLGDGTKVRTLQQLARDAEESEQEQLKLVRQSLKQKRFSMPVWAVAGVSESAEVAEQAQLWLDGLGPELLNDLAALLRESYITLAEPTAQLDADGKPVDPRLVLRCFFEDNGGDPTWEPYLLLSRG
jgi:hypothetical protein